jgi:hypothetical protein
MIDSLFREKVLTSADTRLIQALATGELSPDDITPEFASAVRVRGGPRPAVTSAADREKALAIHAWTGMDAIQDIRRVVRLLTGQASTGVPGYDDEITSDVRRLLGMNRVQLHAMSLPNLRYALEAKLVAPTPTTPPAVDPIAAQAKKKPRKPRKDHANHCEESVYEMIFNAINKIQSTGATASRANVAKTLNFEKYQITRWSNQYPSVCRLLGEPLNSRKRYQQGSTVDSSGAKASDFDDAIDSEDDSEDDIPGDRDDNPDDLVVATRPIGQEAPPSPTISCIPPATGLQRRVQQRRAMKS